MQWRIFNLTFPTIAAYTEGQLSGTTTPTVPLPSGISAGHLLMVFLGTDGDNTITDWDGFTELYSDSNGAANSFHVGYKIAGGSEVNWNPTLSQNEPTSYVTYRITGHECDTLPPEASPGVKSSSNTPDPDELSGLTWAQDDTLWIACCACDRRGITGFPSNYTIMQREGGPGGPGGCSAGAAGRNLNAESDNPGTFLLDGSDTWNAVTVAVPPDGAAAPEAGEDDIIKKINRNLNGNINNGLN